MDLYAYYIRLAPPLQRFFLQHARPYGLVQTATIRNTVTNGAPGSVRPTDGRAWARDARAGMEPRPYGYALGKTTDNP